MGAGEQGGAEGAHGREEGDVGAEEGRGPGGVEGFELAEDARRGGLVAVGAEGGVSRGV